jgi:hypothetical protein
MTNFRQIANPQRLERGALFGKIHNLDKAASLPRPLRYQGRFATKPEPD